MKKKVLCILIAGSLLVGCGKEAELPQEDLSVQDPVVESVVEDTEDSEPIEDVENEANEDEATSGETAEYVSSDITVAASVEETYDLVKDSLDKDGESFYSFSFEKSSLKDMGDYYEQAVLISKPVTIKNDAKVGDAVEIEWTYQNLETTIIKLIKQNENMYINEENDEEYGLYESTHYPGCYEMYYASDDRVDTVFAKGIVKISKNAICGYAIEDNYHTLTQKDLVNEYDDFVWYNGVKFDDAGVINALVFYGD